MSRFFTGLSADRQSCFVYYMGSNWTDPKAPRDKDGVQMRVPGFGGTYALDKIDPESIVTLFPYYHQALETLRLYGFDDGRTIFGAPFDWRYLPSPQWIADTRDLIETAVAKTGQKVVLVVHSLACQHSYMFLMHQSLEWRQKHIAHWLPLSPVWAGSPLSLYAILTKDFFGLPGYLSKIGAIADTMQTAFELLPNMRFGKDVVLASTPTAVYTAANITLLLERAGIAHAAVAVATTRAALDATTWQPPGVPTTIVWSHGFKSVLRIKYSRDSDIGKQPPGIVFGDGDGLVTNDSLRYLSELWAADPLTQTIALGKGFHGEVPHDKVVLELVLNLACNNGTQHHSL